MFGHKIHYISFIIFHVIFSNYTHASIEKNTSIDQDSAQAYINYAISKKNSDLDAAASSLEHAYYLAKKNNNKDIIAKIVLEQAQIAKLQKNYFLAQKYLSKAETLIPPLNNAQLSVKFLTQMSTIQRYLNKYQDSLHYVQSAIAIARESREPTLIFMCLQIKGTLLLNMKRYDDAITSYLSAQRYMDSESLLNKIELFRDTANAYNKANEYQSSIKYYKKTLSIIDDSTAAEIKLHTLTEIAKTHAKIAEYSPALENAKLSLKLARVEENNEHILKNLIVLSTIYRKISSYESALSSALEAIKIYQNINDNDGLAAAANAIGLVYIHLGQTEQAKSYFSQVIDLPSNKIKTKYRAAALRSLGKLMFATSQDSQGLKLSNQAHNLYEKIGDTKGVATVQKNIGYIYYKMGLIDEAVHSYNLANDLFQKLNDMWNEAETKAYLSTALLNVDTEQSISLALNSLQLALDIGAKSIAEQAYGILILAEEKNKNYKQALNYVKKRELLSNEIRTDAINKRSAEIHIILDVEKKERAYERLKREKAIISLELENKKSRLTLLEKEKEITDLQAQNTVIIFSVIVIIFILILKFFKIKHISTRLPLVISTTVIFSLLLYSVNSYSIDIIKLTQSGSSLDNRPKYTRAILKQALEFSSKKYGPYEIQIINRHLTNSEEIWRVHEGNYINLTMAMTSPDWEYLALPIRIPIRRGIGSYRLLTINKLNKDKFTSVNTVQDLKSLSIGLQTEWILNDLLKEEGFITVESSSYDGVFRMLDNQRFDFTPRGVHEAYDEISIRQNLLKNLMIEPKLAIYIPQPYYIFVSPKYPKIAERIEYGLEEMILTGELQRMFNEHYAGFIKNANLTSRTILNIENKYLTNKTPINRKELWIKFDIENGR